MPDSGNQERRKAAAGPFAPQWQGAALVALLAIFVGGVARTLRWKNDRFPLYHYISFVDYIVFIVFAVLLILVIMRGSIFAEVLQVFVAAFVLFALVQQPGLGVDVADASPNYERHFESFGAASDALNAFGAFIFLAYGLQALFARLRRRSRAATR